VLACTPHNPADKAMVAASRAEKAIEVKNYAAALAHYEEASRLEPGSQDWVYDRGRVKYLMGQREGALKDFKKALDLAPGDWSMREETRNLIKSMERGDSLQK
jgi:tetratricopeptide (TPR) repeat protein